MRALGGLWQIALLVTFVIGGMYAWYITVTKAAAIGTLFSDWPTARYAIFRSALRETVENTAILFFIIVGIL